MAYRFPSTMPERCNTSNGTYNRAHRQPGPHMASSAHVSSWPQTSPSTPTGSTTALAPDWPYGPFPFLMSNPMHPSTRTRQSDSVTSYVSIHPITPVATSSPDTHNDTLYSDSSIPSPHSTLSPDAPGTPIATTHYTLAPTHLIDTYNATPYTDFSILFSHNTMPPNAPSTPNASIHTTLTPTHLVDTHNSTLATEPSTPPLLYYYV